MFRFPSFPVSFCFSYFRCVGEGRAVVSWPKTVLPRSPHPPLFSDDRLSSPFLPYSYSSRLGSCSPRSVPPSSSVLSLPTCRLFPCWTFLRQGCLLPKTVFPLSSFPPFSFLGRYLQFFPSTKLAGPRCPFDSPPEHSPFLRSRRSIFFRKASLFFLWGFVPHPPFGEPPPSFFNFDVFVGAPLALVGAPFL